MDAEQVLGLACAEALFSVQAEAAAQFRHAVGGHGKADGEGMATEAREEVAAGFNCFEQLKAIDGTAGAVGDAIFNANYDGGLGGAFYHARGEDADDAAMPSVALDNEHAAGGELMIVEEARLTTLMVTHNMRHAIDRGISLGLSWTFLTSRANDRAIASAERP